MFDLSQVDWDILVESSTDVNEALEKWSALLSLIIEKHTPMRTLKVSDKLTPWLTTDFRKLARSRDKLKSSAVKNKSSILMNSYKHVQDKVNNLGKKLKRDYLTKKIALYKGNLKQSWKTINHLLNKRSKTTNVSCLDVEGHNVTDSNEIAQSMNDFFCSIGKMLSDDIPQQPNPLLTNEYNINENDTSFQFKTVFSVSVEKALKKMKTSFGFGSDGIASHFIKIAFPINSHSLCRIYNMSIESGIFPDSWKLARVTPIFKSGSTEDRSNYRPISVLPVLSRLFEKLIYDQLYEYLDSNKQLSKDQYGFRNMHLVVSCLLNSTNDWCVNIERGKFIAMIFIDLKKAFDTVDYHILLNKMRNYGIDGLEHRWFSSCLNNRRQFCRVNGVSSDPAEINIGVPQCSCLGPLLFLIYINDLPFALKRAKETMHADDTAISFSSNDMEEIDAVVNAELACVEKWLQGNKLSLNVVKTQAMIIGSSQKLRKIYTPMVPISHFQVNGNDIDFVKEIKYLGLMIDENLKWESNVKYTQKKSLEL